MVSLGDIDTVEITSLTDIAHWGSDIAIQNI